MINFKRLATGIDISPLLASLENQPALFSELTARQYAPGSPHVDTESVFLRWSREQTIAAAFTDLKAVDYPAYAKIPEAKELVERIQDEVQGTHLGRVLIVNLRAGGYIEKHVDEGAYADFYERFHLVLKADDGNIFFCDNDESCGEYANMRPGELWWFNHKKPHSVLNDSKSGRIHLIVDVVAPQYRREREAVAA